MRVRFAPALLAAVLTACSAAAAHAAYPERPIRIVVVVPPGTGADTMARTIAQRLSEQMKQSVVVENRPGASSVVGSEAVARAAPDGYSLLLLNSAQTGAAALSAKFPLDLMRDFAPVAMLGKSPYIFAVSNAFPPKTVQEFIDYAKANPGRINYGSGGYGSPAHLGMELLAIMAGIRLTHVPYKGQAAYNAALATDEIQIAMGTVPGFLPVTSAGRARAFAAGGATAPKEYPAIPTIAGSGFPGYDIDIWYSLVTTAGTPPDVVRRLSEELRIALADPALRADLERKGYTASWSSPEDLGAYIRTDIDRWRDVVRRANLADPDARK
ncbi:MAG: ABC transporter substrate-binding protein [Betaproteobacteria bacterium]|nr:MAG: ABC transporter substrate-binding protein [Betaproteobacteria bacterium]